MNNWTQSPDIIFVVLNFMAPADCTRGRACLIPNQTKSATINLAVNISRVDRYGEISSLISCLRVKDTSCQRDGGT